MRHCRSIDSEYNRSFIGNFYNAIFEDIQDRLPVLGVFSMFGIRLLFRVGFVCFSISEERFSTVRKFTGRYRPEIQRCENYSFTMFSFSGT